MGAGGAKFKGRGTAKTYHLVEWPQESCFLTKKPPFLSRLDLMVNPDKNGESNADKTKADSFAKVYRRSSYVKRCHTTSGLAALNIADYLNYQPKSQA